MMIRIFTTGGTIDKVYFDAKSGYKIGGSQVAYVLSRAGVGVEYTVKTLMRKDSLNLADEDRAVIRAHVEGDDCSRILITHGTDSMIETAARLEGIPNKTIVLVGSLTPARFKNSDAEFNVGFAFAAVQVLAPGTYIAMNGRIFAANRVRKNRALNRFESTHPA